MWSLWDFCELGRLPGAPLQNLIAEWSRDDVQPAQQARLNVKLGAIEIDRNNEGGGVDKPHWVSGPIKRYPNLYEVKVSGNAKGVNTRLIVCRGPQNPRAEITLLYGAQEKDGKWVPRNALETASTRYDRLCADARLRCPHEWVPPGRAE